MATIDRYAKAVRDYTNYRLNFPDQTGAYETGIDEDPIERAQDIEKADGAEAAAGHIENRLLALRKAISSSNSAADLSGLFTLLAVVAQNSATAVGLKLAGPKATLADSVARNEAAIASLAKEIACKRGTEAIMEPEYRLAFLLAGSVWGVHAQNLLEEKKIAKNNEANGIASPGSGRDTATAEEVSDKQCAERHNNISNAAEI